jgi:hypothetical protein
MAEFDFEIPVGALNSVMDRIVSRRIFLRWLFLNEERETFSVRLVVPDVEVEEVLLELSEILEEPTEISIIKGSEFQRRIDQAFVASLEVEGKRYPVVVFMEFDFSPRMPSKVVILTRRNCPEDVIKSILKAHIGPFTFEDPSNTKIIESDNITKILVKSPVKAGI